ncbi:MAG: cupin domain-containing protein [Bryobacteraceae bacterium]|nr:cupin domain-containing protein [Bryobacteraceae bacterium]
MKLHHWPAVAREQMNDQVVRQHIHATNMTVARLEIQQGAMVPEHHHINEQLSLVISGRMKFIFPDKTIEAGPGDMVEIPPNVPHRVEFLEDCVVYDLFAPVREDWIRGDDAYLRQK